MREIKIGFSSRNGFAPISWAIKAYEGTPYSHVYFRYTTDWKTDLIYQASGTMVNFMAGKVFDEMNTTHKEFTFQISEEAWNLFMAWATTVCGRPYARLQPLGIMMMDLLDLEKNPFADGQKAWVCSELVSFGLADAIGIHLSPHTFEKASPKDLYAICSWLSREVKNGNLSIH